MNSIAKPHAKRKRGLVLSPGGLRRLNQAIQVIEAEENAGKRFTSEELSIRTGISTSTLSRLWASKSGIDRRTINLLFNAFHLDLLSSDIQPLTDEVEAIPPSTRVDSSRTVSQIPYPSGPIPVDSPRYISRPGMDNLAFQEILQPSCTIRIKAPSGFGKSSLMLRLLQSANQQGYATAAINLQQVDTETLADPRSFLRWFSTVLSRKLKLDSKLDQYWDDLLGSKISTTLYLREAILPQLHRPLVLVINEVERAFECFHTAKNLLPLLRSWHEESQHDDVWKGLRLVLSYSTDAYLPLDINQSPFNIGLPLSLPEFNQEQIQKLAELYLVSWSDAACDRLFALIGGKPSLVGFALYHLHQGMELDELLQSAPTLEGIYRNHLQRLLAQINTYSHLIDRLKLLVRDKSPTFLDPVLAYKLEGMGLIKSMSGGWQLSCELYRITFQTYLFNL
ncbi:hypothetical protein F7734_02210 [Scytonema sp. UIC 10036]|uniref:AAA-like domain-containing protein n=1 Tax=Scytonema sp. UIC 10036 TaxID=2304196 RepID=UPI0012DAA302|nr:AAA-like domain-containing protein [Scytonema sp. UIC 10036]MUG91364.1 hypothetical protein [Scytonema sp. UIC 10036]